MLTVVENPMLLFFIQVVRDMPADQREHFEAMTGYPYDVDGIAIGNFMVQGPKWAILNEDGRAIAVGGFVPQRPGVYRDFFLSTPDAFSKANYRVVTRTCRELMSYMLATSAHRLECLVPAVRVEKMPQIERWYKILGYSKEATHFGYCANGGDAFRYSRVNH